MCSRYAEPLRHRLNGLPLQALPCHDGILSVCFHRISGNKIVVPAALSGLADELMNAVEPSAIGDIAGPFIRRLLEEALNQRVLSQHRRVVQMTKEMLDGATEGSAGGLFGQRMLL